MKNSEQPWSPVMKQIAYGRVRRKMEGGSTE